MRAFLRNFYDYLEVRELGQKRAVRKRGVDAIDDPFGSPDRILNWHASLYPWYLSYDLEGRSSAAETEGSWSLTANRIMRQVGDPGRDRWPYKDRSQNAVDPRTLTPRVRLHHYFPVYSAEDARTVSASRNAINLSIKVTEEWYNPSKGNLRVIPEDSPVLGTHSICACWNSDQKGFVFPNSWGEEWGQNGWGIISSDVFDRYLVDCWAFVGLGVSPPLGAASRSIAILWKCSRGGGEVHGREIVNAQSGERIGWCLMVRTGRILAIEDFFVWPEYRGRGYGRFLADLSLELAREMQAELQLNVRFVDAASNNRSALLSLAALLKLHLHTSTRPGLAFEGTPRPNIVALQEPTMPSPPASTVFRLDPAAGTRIYTVWYGTNRRPIVFGDSSNGYSGERDNIVHYGKCDVSIPQSHRFGDTGSAWYKRWLRRDDDRLLLMSITGLEQDLFWTDMQSTLQDLHVSDRDALVFLHGYNTSFEMAAIRAAQIGYDLRFPGVTAFFSWASSAKVRGYLADEATIEASSEAIAGFIRDLSAVSGAQRIHVIAHSMGNRGLLRALQTLQTTLARESPIMLNQVVLAAPDVDKTTFEQLAQFVTNAAQRTTLYSSPKDRAVRLSRVIHQYPRAGLTPPVTVVPGIDTIDIPNLRFGDVWWHGYFAEAEGLLNDIFNLLRHNAPPERRQRLIASSTPDGGKYWTMEK
jgi:esterase/lipase superfamily enzyme/GNAT superfamily N-acetyltransferase